MTDTRREQIVEILDRHTAYYVDGAILEEAADEILSALTTAPEAGWRGIPISTNERLPEKPGKRSYEHVRCLIFIHGEWEFGMWNCEHLVWDDDEGDDFRYHPTEPTHWMPLPPAPGEPATEQQSVKEAARVLKQMAPALIACHDALVDGEYEKAWYQFRQTMMKPFSSDPCDVFEEAQAAALRSLAGDE